MKTRYFGIESIFVIEMSRATIAANIMHEGKFYDEPVYTNIFCSYDELCYLLNLENSSLSKEILADIKTQSIISDKDQIEIHLPPYINNQIEWKCPIMVDLKISKTDDIPFECYRFTNLSKSNSQTNANS